MDLNQAKSWIQDNRDAGVDLFAFRLIDLINQQSRKSFVISWIKDSFLAIILSLVVLVFCAGSFALLNNQKTEAEFSAEIQKQKATCEEKLASKEANYADLIRALERK